MKLEIIKYVVEHIIVDFCLVDLIQKIAVIRGYQSTNLLVEIKNISLKIKLENK
jgi:hypothetical protein